MESYLIILSYRLKSFVNRLKNLDKWKKIKNIIFTLSILILLIFLYIGFIKILNYLKGVDIVGVLLIWKLSSMVLLINFFMIAISSLIISLTTLFYSSDLKFLFSLPFPLRTILADKILLSVFYSSWSLIVIMMPYIIALVKTLEYGFLFILAFLILLIPYSFLASYFGILTALILMYIFPSSKTRDTVWVLSSFSFAGIYMSLRFSKPEKLLNPDALGLIANYLSYLQAPTAKYLPSWWFTKSLMSFSNGNYYSFFIYSFLQYAIFGISTILLLYFGGKIYLHAFSGAQNTYGKIFRFSGSFEFRISKRIEYLKSMMMLFFKERINFTRDIRYFSQTILVFALSMVYVFSIRNIPIDGDDAKNFVAFINIVISGFVISALALRFVFTSVSLEDGNVWIIKNIPVKASTFLYSKLLFYFLYILFFNLILVALSNHYLGIDSFIFSFSVFTSVIMSFTISTIAVSMGAIFPDFNIENIHHVESSYGGFLFMAIAVTYTIGVAVWFAYPIRIYFMSKYLKNFEFDSFFFYSSIVIFVFLSWLISAIFFKRAVLSFENKEV